jgi:hypothetical protein
MAVELLKNEYETPRALVRGVFLCDNLADTVSVLTWDISQDDWSTSLEETVGEGLDNPEGNITVRF